MIGYSGDARICFEGIILDFEVIRSDLIGVKKRMIKRSSKPKELFTNKQIFFPSILISSPDCFKKRILLAVE